MMNLIEKFQETMGHDLGAPACIYNGRVMSRAQLYQMVCQLSLALHERGVREGDVVGVSLNHSPAHLALLVALARLGAVSLPVHPRTNPAGKLALMKRFGATRVISMKLPASATDVVAARRAEGIEIIEINTLKPTGEQKPLSLDFTDYWPKPDLLARIGLTSGTTGAPAAVCYSQAYWVERIATTVEGCDAQTRLMPGNLHLTMGNLAAFAALFAGGVVVFHRQQELASFIETINLHGVTHAMTAPATIKGLAAQLPFAGNAVPSLKYLRFVGGAVSEHLVKLAREKITPNVYLSYGISEVGVIAISSPEVLHKYPDHAGKVKPGVTVEVVDAAGKVLKAGETGELRVKLPSMLPGYYKNEQRTAEKFRDGWFYTSDIGSVDKNGLIKIDGRSDDKINLGGMKFYPERVERVLDAHPEVNEAAIFTMPDKNNEPVLVAAVVLSHEGKPDQDLVEYCREKKLGNMTPRRFFIVKELPRNPAGKVVRASLPGLLKKPDATLH